MPIVCLEGPSAAGKTTTAFTLAVDGGVHVVPEVNALFERPADETHEWYFERPVDRWALAAEAALGARLVIHDGDPFQPLWYNWAYHFQGRQGLDFMQSFYRSRLIKLLEWLIGDVVDELGSRAEVEYAYRILDHDEADRERDGSRPLDEPRHRRLGERRHAQRRKRGGGRRCVRGAAAEQKGFLGDDAGDHDRRSQPRVRAARC